MAVRGLGCGVTGATANGEGVFFGRATTATFGAARVGCGFGVVFAWTNFGFAWTSFGFGFGFSVGVGVTRAATVRCDVE